jgi:putative NADPH-quinone reductase
MRLLEGLRAVSHAEDRRILVVNGHPDPRPERFCAALCEAYGEGARQVGSPVRRLTVGTLSLAPDTNAGCIDLETAMADIHWATHVIVVFPLWLNRPPDVVRSLFEYWSGHGLQGGAAASERSMRAVITMEMPAFAHRAMLRCGINVNQLSHRLLLPGFRNQEQGFIGSVESISAGERTRWLNTMRNCGATAL